MQVYSAPEHIKYDPDYGSYNFENEQAKEAKFRNELLEWAHTNGWTGKHTGRIVRFGVADGYAEYFIIESGRKFALVHMPFGDAYQMPYINRLTKADIIKQLVQEENLRAIFGRK